MSLVKRRIPQTKPLTRRLSDIANHVIIPEGIVSTGWPAVRDTLAELGIGFDDWQQSAAQLILSKDADGFYATTVGGCTLSIPRQVGKTYLIGWIAFALCIITPGITVVWTAHRASTADETFDGMKKMAQTPKVAPHVDRTPDNGSEKAIEFRNGSRVVFGARERGFGRGFAELHVVVFDEAQILTERSIDDMVPAQNAATNALTLMIGTPPRPIDPSEVFEDARRAALSGEAKDALYIELSADRKADLDDREQWKKANPSFPGRTNLASMMRMRRRLSEVSFRREAMGIWDEIDAMRSAIPAGAWNELAIEEVPDDWPLAAIGLDMNPERTRVSIAVSAFAPEHIHVELAEDSGFSDAGSKALVDWIFERAKRRVPVVIDAYSPARSLEPELKKRGCLVRVMGAAELSQACGGLYDAAMLDQSVTHFGQAALNDSLAGATKENFGPAGAWKWNRKSLDVDLSPLMAATAAHFGAVKFAKKPRADGAEKRKTVIL
jgi:hypothetical protein